MPDPAITGGPAGGAPGGVLPSPPGATPPQAQSTGASPATSPVPNEGIKAAARARVANVTSVLYMLGAAFAGSEEAQHITKAIQELNKVATPRDMSPGLMNADLQKMQMMQRQNQMNAVAMRNQGQAAPPAAAPA